MSNLTITRIPQFLDPWFVEIEQVWDELEASVNDNDSRISALESSILSDVVTSISKQGDAQLKGNVTFTGAGSVTLTQAGQNIEIAGTGITDHGALSGLLDDDHSIYILVDGSRAFTGNISFGNNQATSFRVENVAVLPGAGNQGRLVFDQNDLKLKVDDGSSFVQIGVTDHSALSNLLVDTHTQYVLVDGSRAITGNLTVNGQYTNEVNEPLTMVSQDNDDASAVAFVLDTANELTDNNALLLSIRNNGVEKFSIDKDGNIISGIATVSPTSLAVLIDTDNNSSTEAFTVEHDSTIAGSGETLFSVNETGQANLPLASGGLRIGSSGVPSDMLDVDGDADINGVLKVAQITSTTNLTITLDSNDDETAEFIIKDGLLADVVKIDEAGNIQAVGLRVGTLGVPTNTFDLDGDMNISGDMNWGGNFIGYGGTKTISSDASMIFQVDSDDDQVSSFIWQAGDGSTVMTLDESGNLVTTGTITGGASPFSFISNSQANEGTPATGSITIINNTFDAGDSITITEPDMTANTFEQGVDFTVGVDADETALNLASEINSAAIGLEAQAVANVINLTVLTVGTEGNSYALAENDGATDNFTLSGANLSGGTDVASVAFELDTTNDHTAVSGSKLLSLKNNGVEVFYIDADGDSPAFGGGIVTTVEAAAGGAGIQSAINTVSAAGGGIVQLLAGTFNVDAPITLPSGTNNLTVQGIGGNTIISIDDSILTGFQFTNSLFDSLTAANNTSTGDTSVTTTTAGDAAPYLVGDRISIEGTDADGSYQREWNIVAVNGVPGTGVIALEKPLIHNMTVVTIAGARNGENIHIKDMNFIVTASIAGDSVIQLSGLYRSSIQNISVDTIEGSGGTGVFGINAHSIDVLLKNCEIKETLTGHGFAVSDSSFITYDDCKIYKGAASGFVGRFGSSDITIKNCKVFNLDSGDGIILEGDTNMYRRLKIKNNHLESIFSSGIRVQTRDSEICSNILLDTAQNTAGSSGWAAIRLLSECDRVLIDKNIIKRSRVAIFCDNNDDIIISNNIIDETHTAGPAAYGILSGTSSNGFIVTGNVVSNCIQQAILMQGDNHVISNNVVHDNTIDGIFVQLGSGLIITGNKTYNNTGDGIQLENTITDSIVMGNNCIGDNIIEGTGAGNTFIGNKE